MCECQSMITLGHAALEHRRRQCERKAGPGQRQDQARAKADRAGSAGARLKCSARDSTNVPLFAANSVCTATSWFVRSRSLAQAEPERFGHDTENLGVVHL